MLNLGDFPSQQTVYLITNAHKGDGTPIDGAGGLAVSVYKDDGTTEFSGTDITLTGPFDSRTGLISIKIVTTNAFFAANHDYFVVVTTGTVDSISVVSYVLASFSIENRSALRPTTAGRTLDVAAGGEAGIDLTNRLDTTGILPSAQAGGSGGLALVGSAMTVADKTGFALLQAFPANFASLAISSLGKVTVGTNDDKTGYALTSALTAQNVWEYAIRALTDKDGFSLSTAPPTVEEIDTELSTNHGSGTWGTGGVGSSSLDITVTSSGEPVEGIMVEVYTSSTKTGFVRKTTTDGAGLAHFDVNAGTYYVWVLHSDYVGTNPTEVTVI
jgi:hypothetical protein